MPTRKDTRQIDREACWERIEMLKTDVLARVAAKPEAAQNTPPVPGEWSPLQVAAHLLKTETLMNDGIASAQEKDRIASRGVPGPVLRFLFGWLRAGIPLPAPDFTQPGVPPPLAQVAADWERQRQILRQHLTDHGTDAVFTLHPLFGALTANQVLEATEAHLCYHLKRFPKTHP